MLGIYTGYMRKSAEIKGVKTVDCPERHVTILDHIWRYLHVYQPLLNCRELSFVLCIVF